MDTKFKRKTFTKKDLLRKSDESIKILGWQFIAIPTLSVFGINLTEDTMAVLSNIGNRKGPEHIQASYKEFLIALERRDLITILEAPKENGPWRSWDYFRVQRTGKLTKVMVEINKLVAHDYNLVKIQDIINYTHSIEEKYPNDIR